MNSLFLLRLTFDLCAAALLVFGLSYWWLGNVAHELAGAAMFVLVIVHNIFNRRWYGAVAKTRREPRNLINIAVTFILLMGMLTLLVTSVLISNALSDFLSAYGGFTVREIHTLAAYWVLVIVAVHLGLRWPLIMGVARGLLGISQQSRARTIVLRVAAAAISAHGVWSFFVLDLGAKLSMRTTLDWWNFEELTAGFFIHCIAVAGLVISLTYYALKLIERPIASLRHPPR